MTQWIPMLLDGLIVVLFVGGCLLFWLNFRPRGREVLLPPKDTVHPRIEEQTADPELESRHCKKSASQLEAIVEYTAPAIPAEESVSANSGDMIDLNGYAGRIALAMNRVPNRR